MKRLFNQVVALVAAVTLATAATSVSASASPAAHVSNPTSRTAGPGHMLAEGLDGALGSTVGPDGALYVVEGVAGRIARIDPRTGHTSVFASGLPKRVVAGLGGATDVAFLGRQAYALVTLVSPDVGGTSADGIYRIDGPTSSTLVADIGTWSIDHPPKTAFEVPSGVQFALQAYRGHFLVTDGHHNRVLEVTRRGAVSELRAFGDIVPTGLAVQDRTIYLAEAGPVPHLPQDGMIVTFRPGGTSVRPVASGAPLLVDVELGRDGSLFALAQGHFTPGHPAGSPADPGTGLLERVHRDGTMTPVAQGLDRPSSLEIIGNTAYVVTLTGQVWAFGVGGHAHH